MNWLNIKTEYSFGAVYGPIDLIMKTLKRGGATSAGIADIDGTWGHVPWAKACEENDIKPIFGVSLPVVEDIQAKDRRGQMCRMTFIALTNRGLKQIYELVEIAHNNFYYMPRIEPHNVNSMHPNDVVVLSGPAPTIFREYIIRPYLLQLGPDLPQAVRKCPMADVACIDNWYPRKKDKATYEPFADPRKLERKTTPMHIMTDLLWLKTMGDDRGMALSQRNNIAGRATAVLQKAPLVTYPQEGCSSGTALYRMCKKGAKHLGVDLDDPVYKKRVSYEFNLIQEKGFADYFLIVAKLIEWAKDQMLVGPGRGSSGGSLVCYLLGITTFDPIKYGLIFERFIDINRTDLPDIDCDFQDSKRPMVIKYLKKHYGLENVSQIGNVNKLKGKSALNRYAKAFGIPTHSLDELKEALIERPDGDARVNKCIQDTFTTSKQGQQYLKMYPNMKVAAKIDGHASHAGVHAAGVIVSNKPITDFCGINTREARVAMLDMREAEWLNLLKIDALGLRTLTILAQVCDDVRMEYRALYDLPDGDKKAYKLLNQKRFTGIFQLEGAAAKNLAMKMKIKSIEDISAISAVARPGPLSSGGAGHFIKRKTGEEDVEYLAKNKVLKKITKPTMGVIVYQEQVMKILKEVGQLSWEDVIFLRKQIGKSKGVESMGTFAKPFIKGCKKSGMKKLEAQELWEKLVTFGQYGFNKSHSVAYAIVSYWCAYLKAHYPMSFAVASLNNAKSDRDALKTLRDLVENEGISYVPFNFKYSQVKWAFKDKTLFGGFETLDGIGPVTAKKAVMLRSKGQPLPTGIQKHVDALVTPFLHLYPAQQLYAKHWKQSTPISEVTERRDVTVIGCLTRKSIRDANEPSMIAKRKGRVHEGPTTYLVMSLEDDTGEILSMIGREEFDELEEKTSIAAEGKVDKDWYKIFGSYHPDFNIVYIKKIWRITNEK